MGEFITVADILAACSDGRGRPGREDGGMCRCPVHGGVSLSVGVGDRGQPIVLNCFGQGCGFEAIRDRLVDLIGKPWPAPNITLPGRQRAARYRGPAAEACAVKVMARLEELGAVSPITDTLAEKYLIGRGIGSYVDSQAFRYVPEGPSRGMLVSLICNTKTGRVQSYQTTSLYRNPTTGRVGKAREPAKLLAKGFTATGGVIPLDGHDEPEEVVIGEGMETAASAGLRFELPAWAAISAGNLRKLKLPPHVESVIIAADNDASGTGLDAAYDAAARWRDAGLRVRIIMPSEEDTDFNDYRASA